MCCKEEVSVDKGVWECYVSRKKKNCCKNGCQPTSVSVIY